MFSVQQIKCVPAPAAASFWCWEGSCGHVSCSTAPRGMQINTRNFRACDQPVGQLPRGAGPTDLLNGFRKLRSDRFERQRSTRREAIHADDVPAKASFNWMAGYLPFRQLGYRRLKLRHRPRATVGPAHRRWRQTGSHSLSRTSFENRFGFEARSVAIFSARAFASSPSDKDVRNFPERLRHEPFGIPQPNRLNLFLCRGDDGDRGLGDSPDHRFFGRFEPARRDFCRVRDGRHAARLPATTIAAKPKRGRRFAKPVRVCLLVQGGSALLRIFQLTQSLRHSLSPRERGFVHLTTPPKAGDATARFGSRGAARNAVAPKACEQVW